MWAARTILNVVSVVQSTGCIDMSIIEDNYKHAIIYSDDQVKIGIIWPAEGFEPTDGGKSYYRNFAVLPEQTHSLNVAVVNDIKDFFPDTDGLISLNPAIPVGVVTADCVPIFLYAPDLGAAAAVHAGWKGTLGGIVDKAVKAMSDLGADPVRIHVFFGPSISGEVYEVSPDLAALFAENGFDSSISFPAGEGGRPHIDLQDVNIKRLMKLGVKEGHIMPCSLCTLSATDSEGHPYLPSHRRSGGSPARLLSYIIRQ